MSQLSAWATARLNLTEPMVTVDLTATGPRKVEIPLSMADSSKVSISCGMSTRGRASRVGRNNGRGRIV